MSVSARVVLDTRRIKKSNKYPVKARVVFKRNTRDFQTVYDLSKEEFGRLTASRISDDLAIIRDNLKKIKRNADAFIEDNRNDFSYDEFEVCFVKEEQLFKKRKDKEIIVEKQKLEDFFNSYLHKFKILKEVDFRHGTILPVFVSCVKRLIMEKRIGSALNYQRSYIDLHKFKGNVYFSEITPPFLYQFEEWMMSRSVTKTTVGIALRPLRAVFNEAIADGIIKREKCYPFGRRKYLIPNSRNIKKALTAEDLHKIYFYRSDNPELERARDMWLFGYFANGMNSKDVAHLKWNNIQDEFIVFHRAKTERALRSDPKPITVFLSEDLLRIIAKWSSEKTKPNDYIFPVLEISMSVLDQHFKAIGLTKFINDGMAIVSKELGLSRKVTTIYGRHTFSTQMKRAGASTEFIREALGHTDKRTTENYLDSFESDLKKEFAQKLNLFKKLF